MTITTTNGFTQPPVDGSTTVTVSVSDVTGACIGAGCQIAGAGFYLITNISAPGSVTLLNSGSYVNVAPSTVLGSLLVVTYGGLTAPIGEPALSISGISSAGQALVYNSSGVFQPIGVPQVISVRAFGAKGDGTTDDTTAIQNGVNYANSHGGVLYFPPGNYIISSTINCVANSNCWSMQGQVAATYPEVTVITWNGAVLQPMFTFESNESVGSWQVNDIDFNGGLKAWTAWWLPSGSTIGTASAHWRRCGFTQMYVTNYWTPGTAYSTGNIVAGPGYGLLHSSFGNPSVNGYVYQCTTGGTSQTNHNGVAWDDGYLNTSRTVVDGTAHWQMIGRLGCGVVIGTETALGGGYQVSEIRMWECYFVGSGNTYPQWTNTGFMVLGGFNTKNFSLTDCQFLNCGRGVNGAQMIAAGMLALDRPVFADSSECDLFLGATQTTVNNFESEGATRFIISVSSGLNGAGCTVTGGQWFGNPLPTGSFPNAFGANFCTIIYSGSLQLTDVQLDASCVVGSGSISAGSNEFTLTSLPTSSPGFYPSDVGKSFSIPGILRGQPAPPGPGPGGSTLTGTITKYIDNTHVLLSVAASNTVSNISIEMPYPPYTCMTNMIQDGTSQSSFSSVGSYYQMAPFLPVVDSGGYPLTGDVSVTPGGTMLSNVQYQANQTRISSINDVGTLNDNVTPVNFHNHFGNNLTLGTQQPCNNQTQGIFAGAIPYYAHVTGSVFKVTVPYTMFNANSTTQTVNIGGFFGITRIKACYANVTTTFDGYSGGNRLSDATVSIGSVLNLQGGGVTFNNTAFLNATNIFSISTSTFIGTASGDLGTDLSSPVQGAYLLVMPQTSSAPNLTQQWALTATVTAGHTIGNGSVTNFTQGSIDVYFIYERFSFYGNGQTIPG